MGIRTLPLKVSFALAIALFYAAVRAKAQTPEVAVWEFDPYKVEVWCTFDPEVTASTFAREQFKNYVRDELDRTFGAAWRLSVRDTPAQLRGTIGSNLSELSVGDIQYNELVLVVSKTDIQTKAIRTFEAAVDLLDRIAISPSYMSALSEAIKNNVAENGVAENGEAETTNMQREEDAQLGKLLSKCVVEESVGEKLTSGEVTAALIPRFLLPSDDDQYRQLITLLPWQTESLFRQRDKLLFLHVGMRGRDFTFQVRELDCPMRYLGPTMTGATDEWSYASRVAAALSTRAFAPIARMEDANSTSTTLLMRAGGLILDAQNPAAILPGDVLHPILRRDDRNGVPQLLQPQAWTYAAVTESDGREMLANVYAYSGGTGLQGRRNRRTQRILLRVRPVSDQTEIEVVVAGTDQPQVGCAVYQRDLLTDDFELLGRTDWRGRFTIEVPEDFGAILPAAKRLEMYKAMRDAEAKRAEREKAEREKAEQVSAGGSEISEVSSESDLVDAGPDDLPSEEELDYSEFEVPLNAPLKKIYVKSGNEVLAMLPLVPGIERVSQAGLLDDRRRLETEAFVRGFQHEIIDLIGLRNLLAAQIKLSIKKEDFEQASETFDRLQGLKNYTEMARELDLIQRRLIDESRGEIPRFSKRPIDRMFQNTRNLLQKFLQDELVEASKQSLESAQQAL